MPDASESAANKRAHRHFPVTNSRRQPRRWLLPREHGAYAQLVFPLLTAVALGGSSASAWCWVIAASAAFLAHEPLIVLIGERGHRTRSEVAPRARFTAAFLLILAIGAGLFGWSLAPANARLAALLPIALGAILVLLILGHREKTLVGELIASMTLSSTLLPVALAGGVRVEAALAASIVWAAVFSLLILTVRIIIARVKEPGGSRNVTFVNLILGVAAIAAAFLAGGSGAVPALAAAAVTPAALVTLALTLVRVHPRHLRTVGWSLAATNVVTLIALLSGLR